MARRSTHSKSQLFHCRPDEHLVVLEEVVPEDAGHARVREEVGVPHQRPVLREWPVALRAACGQAGAHRDEEADSCCSQSSFLSIF